MCACVLCRVSVSGVFDRCARRGRGDGGDAADPAVGERVRGHLVRRRRADARGVRPHARGLRLRPLQPLQQARDGEEEGALARALRCVALRLVGPLPF